MGLKLNTASSGSVTLEPANTASNYTLTVPAQTGTIATTVDAGNYYAFKNRIINGNMVINQRAGGTVSNNTTWQYTLDRWAIYGSVSSKFTCQQSTTAPAGFVNSLLITSSSAYSVGSGDQFILKQIIEGYNIADLAFASASASPITLSFWVRSSLTGTFSGAIKNGGGGSTRSYVFSYTINSANTWEQKSVTIAGDTGGTYLTDNQSGLLLWLDLGSGSTYRTTAGSWVNGDYQGATGSQSLVGTTGATFYITGVQLEKGSVATSFDYRPYGTELALCQRYYEVGTAYGEGYTTINAPIGIGSKFSVTKRTTPTMTYPTFTNGTNARAGADRAIYVDSYARYCLANATGSLYAYETFTASAEL